MVESSAHKAAVVDLDEFERRLRSPSMPARGDADPLAELARLVNSDGRREPSAVSVDPFAFDAETLAQPQSSVVRLPTGRWDGVEGARHDAAMRADHPERAAMRAVHSERADPVQTPRPDAEADTLQETFEREMAALHAASRHQIGAAAMAAPANDDIGRGGEPRAYDEHSAAAPALEAGEWPAQQGDARAAPARRARSNRPFYVMGAIAALGLTLIGGNMALRANTSLAGKVAPTIKAAETPVKVAPAPDASASPGQTASILDKAAGGKGVSDNVGDSKLVASAEQPIDLSQAAAKLPNVSQSGVRSTSALAPLVPDVGPATGTPADPKAQPSNPPSTIFSEPRRVRTVAVRPNGSLVSEREPAPAAAPAPAAPPAPAPRPANASQPSPSAFGAAPAKPAAPKTTVRVANVAKPAPKPAVRPDAAADAAPDDINAAADAPLQLPSAVGKVGKGRAKLAAAAPEPTPAADAPAETPAASSGGNWAVQLAAPPSEQEAKETAARLQKQYGGELNGRRPSIRQANSNGRNVFRVRVNSLSRDEAKAMCDRLLAAGGKCFIAQN